jgi:DNA-binding transcriptional ArsR family regulator
MPEQRPQMIDPRLLKALSHPTRILILDILSEGPNSPSGMQERIGGVSLNLLGHHIKVLRDLGFVELVDEVQRRGAKEHIYRATERQYLTIDEWKAVEKKKRPAITATILRMVSEDVGEAFADGEFDTLPDNHLSRVPLEVDQKGWEEVVAVLEEALEKVLAAEKKSRARAKKRRNLLFPIRVVILQFPFRRTNST